MAIYDAFPYTNFHELNLRWLLKKLKEMEVYVATLEPHYFDTVAEMKLADLTRGSLAITKGYHTVNDGGQSAYYVTDNLNAADYQIRLDNGLYATLLVDEYITPLMFGAYGDGINDDGPVLREALNFAMTRNVTLYMPEGTYLINSPDEGLYSDSALVITKPCNIKGYGRGKTIIKAGPSYIGTLHMFYVLGASNVSIEGLTIDGGINEDNPVFPVSVYCHGVRFGNCSDINLTDLEVKNLSGYGIGQQQNSSVNVTIDNVIIKNVGRDGIDFKNFDSNNKAININNVYVSNFGIGPESASDFYTGIDVRADGANISNIYIENISGVNSGLRLKVTNATQGTGGINAAVSNVQIYGDDTNTTTGEGLAINNTGAKVSNVYVHKMAIGVRITDKDNSLTNITVDSCMMQGIRVDADGNAFVNCTIENMTDAAMVAAVDIRAGAQYFTNLKMKNVTTGIEIYSSATAVKIDGLEVDNVTTPFKGKPEKIEIYNAYGSVINTQPVEVSVGYGTSKTYDLTFIPVGYRAYRILIMGHQIFPGSTGLYLITSSNVIPVVTAANLSVSLSGNTLTIANNDSGGTAKGVIF